MVVVQLRRDDHGDRLLAAIRPEFRVDVYIAAPGDPVLFGEPCRVAACDRYARTAFCGFHEQRWRAAGRPDRDPWAASETSRGRLAREIKGCSVSGCGSSAVGRWCETHEGRWRRLGRPDAEEFNRTTSAASLSPAKKTQAAPCRISGCRFPERRDELCDAHHARYKQSSKRSGQTLDEFVAELAAEGRPRFDLTEAPMPLRAEIQYALQCRHDERGSRLEHGYVRMAIKRLAALGITSVADCSDEALGPLPRGGDPVAAFIRYAREHVLRLARDPETEWERDDWDLLVVGFAEPYGIRRLHFRDTPPWMNALVKRWARWRLQSGMKASQVNHNIQGVRHFAQWAAEHRVSLRGPENLTREVLERYALWLAAADMTANAKQRRHSTLKVFLDHVRLHGWEPLIPANALYLKGEAPSKPPTLPRYVEEDVMAQIECEANLARVTDPSIRCALELVIETGLRVGDALGLPFEPLVSDPAGAWYLRFFNHKFDREAVVPISERLVEKIRAQQQRVIGEWEQPTWLFPRRTKNIDGKFPISRRTFSRELRDWLARCEVRDRHGQPVTVTPHQFRHTFATRLLNEGLDLQTVSQLLDHRSLAMTQGYAKLHDRRLREEFDRYQERVTINGERVPLAPEGTLGDAEWTKERLSRAKQTLPNGYCGRPLQQECPHPNACLTCPDFLTTVEFLPIHIEQRAATLRLIEDAEREGHARVADMNKPILINLDSMIAALTEPGDQEASDAA